MSDYYPSPDELRDAWINDYDSGMPMEEDSVRGSETVEANTLEEQTIPCRICGKPTPMLGTKLCDRCWELEHRIASAPEIARRILQRIDDRTEPTCEWFDSLPKPPEPLPWIEAPKATDRHPFE